MCVGRANRGVRSCRNLQAGWDPGDQGGARNMPSPAGRHPRGSPSLPVCRRAARLRLGLSQVQRTVFLRYRTWFDLPDFAGILSNRSVAGKFSRAGHIEDCFACPFALIFIQLAYSFLCPAIRGEVRQVHVVVAVQKGVSQGGENSRLTTAKMIGTNQIHCCSRLGLILIVPARVVPVAAVFDLLHTKAQQEKVLFSSFLGHFDGGAIASSDRQGPVHHELHIARSTGFISGSGDLVRDVTGWEQERKRGGWGEG